MIVEVDARGESHGKLAELSHPDLPGPNAASNLGLATRLIAVPRSAVPYFWPQESIDKILLGSTLAWGALLRLKFLLEPIRFDEASNALYYANRSLVYALAGGAGNDNHV